MPRQTPPSISILPASDPADFPLLASIFDTALKQVDSVHEMFSRYGPKNVYESGIKMLQMGLEDPEHYPAFKAVQRTRTRDDEKGEEEEEEEVVVEKIVGMACWHIGYIEVKKDEGQPVDESGGIARSGKDRGGGPGKVREERAPKSLHVAIQDGDAGDHDHDHDHSGQRGIKEAEVEEEPAFDFYDVVLRPAMNAYIEHIRGKKHIHLRRVAVHPEYQGRGVATKLLQWGARTADEEGLVGWINARPAGLSLYKRAGWEVVRELEMPIPWLHVAPMLCMVRPLKVVSTRGKG